MDDDGNKWLKTIYAIAIVVTILAGALIGWVIYSIKAIGASYGV